MADISPKERLFRVFDKKSVDRPPVICPGGMMNAAIVDIMSQTARTLPEGHHDAELMAGISEDVERFTGFENFGLPFCMTVEAEVLGSEINFGSLSCEPKIQAEKYQSVNEVEYRDIPQILKQGRIAAVAEAGYIISKRHADVPVIGSVTGPVSTAASIVDPMTFLKTLRKDREGAHRVLDYVTTFLIEYARILIDNGVSAISIGDPTATGEILGPAAFKEYALCYINKLIDSIAQTGTPVIVHICGRLDSVKKYVPELRGQALSADALVNLRLLKEEYPSVTTMGNLSTFMLETGTPEKIGARARKLAEDGVDIIAPACGLSTSSPLNNIQALTAAVKEG
jgi:[methyl-Co(III) methanol-specific corrinoid protein]:coenzyme M methyltransferase